MPTTRAKRLAAKKPVRKAKFQADLAPIEDSIVRSLKQELQVTSNSDFLSDAVALFRWAVAERKLGRQIVSESTTGEKKVLVHPRLERVAPEGGLPHATIDWDEKELAHLAHLAQLAAAEPAKPTKALIRAVRS